MFFIILITLMTTIPSVHADCIGCVTEHTEHFENGATQQAYIKKCRAKQKDIEDEYCPGCGCPRKSHSIHRHPYKWHNGSKLPEHALNTADCTPGKKTTIQEPLHHLFSALNNQSIARKKQ